MVAGLRGSRRREQDGVMADAMAAQRLTQHQPAAEDGVLAGRCQPASGRSSLP